MLEGDRSKEVFGDRKASLFEAEKTVSRVTKLRDRDSLRDSAKQCKKEGRKCEDREV